MLMCLAEALLRIPDADTADRLIADKIATGQWSDHLGEADSLFVNASTWGLMLTGRLVRASEIGDARPGVIPEAAWSRGSASRSCARHSARRCASWASSS